jgi:hypothetical protein
MSYATGHKSFMNQYLLNIYIYCRFCRLCIINCEKKIIVEGREKEMIKMNKLKA